MFDKRFIAIFKETKLFVQICEPFDSCQWSQPDVITKSTQFSGVVKHIVEKNIILSTPISDIMTKVVIEIFFRYRKTQIY